MIPDEEDFEERAVIVADGHRITQAEAERIVRQWQQDRQRLPLVTPGQTPTRVFGRQVCRTSRSPQWHPRQTSAFCVAKG